MSSLLKALNFGKAKHKKLPEEWGEGIKPTVNDGMNFYVKYLGSTPVDQPSSESATADAIKSIIAMAKMSGKKLPRISLTIKPSGLTTTDVTSGQKLMDISIYRISYCSADATYDRVVAIICTNKNETLECHAFLTAKKKIAQAAALTISQAFTIAFENWQNAKNQPASTNGSSCNLVKGKKNHHQQQLQQQQQQQQQNITNNDRNGKLNSDTHDHNENKQPTVNNKSKKDSEALIDLSFEEIVPQHLQNESTINNGHSRSKNKDMICINKKISGQQETEAVFDVDLDDSFSKLAQSRSVQSSKGPTNEHQGYSVMSQCKVPFDDSSKSMQEQPSSLANSSSPSTTVATTTTTTNSTTAATTASFILPSNLNPFDFDVNELNSYFSNVQNNKQEHDKFFADADDLFSL